MKKLTLDNGCSIELIITDKRVSYIGYDSNYNRFCSGGFSGYNLKKM